MRNYLWVAMMVATGFVAGCSSTHPQPWNISINKTTYASIDVDLIGITELEKPAWEGYDIDKYWRDGDLRRQNANKITQILKMGQPWTVSIDDPKWQEWMNRGVTELLIIANLPGHFDAGSGDPRRLFLPLDKHSWKAKDDTLEIEIQDTLILVNTPQNSN